MPTPEEVTLFKAIVRRTQGAAHSDISAALHDVRTLLSAPADPAPSQRMESALPNRKLPRSGLDRGITEGEA